MSRTFIGVDAGATRTRALLATEVGEILGTGRAEGANSWSSGTSVSVVISAVVGEAIGEHDPAMVAGGVIAIAGGGTTVPEVAAEIVAGWRRLGAPGTPHIVLDVVAAFAAGTSAPRGVALVAGTGSIAAAIEHGEARRTSGGHGWLLGDEGSAVWLGIHGLQAALRALDGRGPGTVLATTMPEALDIDASDVQSTMTRIVTAAHARPPAQLGRLAPLVVEAGGMGDPLARELLEAAAAELVDLVDAVSDAGPSPVIVLAGSLLTQAPPIRSSVRTRLAERWPAATLAETTSGEAGAVALAIARHTGRPVDDVILARLRRSS